VADRRSIDAPPPIPGERDPHNLTATEPGAIVSGFGVHNPSAIRGAGMDEETIDEHEKEGGGAESERGA